MCTMAVQRWMTGREQKLLRLQFPRHVIHPNRLDFLPIPLPLLHPFIVDPFHEVRGEFPRRSTPFFRQKLVF